ncbi:MAG: hypothetical protein DVB26_02830 [Verrucomicrobia bacterium]|nr:MAG: hypothetical protein DVB26_02830 [Verrucomicrobiota bacterium]
MPIGIGADEGVALGQALAVGADVTEKVMTVDGAIKKSLAGLAALAMPAVASLATNVPSWSTRCGIARNRRKPTLFTKIILHCFPIR